MAIGWVGLGYEDWTHGHVLAGVTGGLIFRSKGQRSRSEVKVIGRQNLKKMTHI